VGVMRAVLTAAVFLGLSFASSANATTIQRVISPGGIEAWLVQDATVPLIAMTYAFEGGSSQDPQDKSGVANLAADLLDEGAGDFDSAAFHDRLARRAIEMSFDASRDLLRGSVRTLKENRDEAFDLTRLALSAARFDSKDVERIRAQLLSGLRRESVSPNSIAARRFYAALFGDHPYGRPTSGTLESVPRISVDDLKAYIHNVVARDTLKVAVVGDIDAATLGVLLDRTFGALPAKASLTPVPPVVAKPGAPIEVQLDVPQTTILFGGQSIPRNDPDFMAAYVVNYILGGGQLTSRLYHEVREKQGLAYSVSESLVWFKDASLVIGSTATRADRAGDTLATVKSEIKRLAEEGPTETELAEAKSYLKGSQMLSLDTSNKIASALLQYQTDGLGIDYIEKRNGIVDAVTLDQAKRVAKQIWGNDLQTVVVGRATPSAAAN
jgi:zinc protease